MSDERGWMGIIFVLLFLLFIILSWILAVYRKDKLTLEASKLGRKERIPNYPDWMNDDRNIPELFEPEDQNSKYIRVYEKDCAWYEYEKHRRMKKSAVQMMRKLFEELFRLRNARRLLPDSTCLISIRKKNFKFGSRPGQFYPKHGGLRNSYFEYQMVGDDRIRITYFVVRGVSFVAGMCIFIENPCQESIRYDLKLIKKLINEPDYWAKPNGLDDSIDIVRRKCDRKLMVITKNRYDESRNWNFNQEIQEFEKIRKFEMKNWEIEKISEIEENRRNQSRCLTLKLCKKLNNIVMIANKPGHNKHAIWNEKIKKFEFFKCEFCDQSDEAPPPSYNSLQILS